MVYSTSTEGVRFTKTEKGCNGFGLNIGSDRTISNSCISYATIRTIPHHLSLKNVVYI